ncbi:hypothetical protein J7355_16170 [Endozoicomonas sp. G2_2]|uniref:hypothetical protein n=1 Tax=Endozoicomonas sp. G2_2 TaxID=2821092 RepID=UPI001ADB6D6B|nr:hypothetical protein [Endozoicomonas sp. G2_2]MBO9471626.1 hypothetical protein [Endozoicomonas sp. G2_2]
MTRQRNENEAVAGRETEQIRAQARDEAQQHVAAQERAHERIHAAEMESKGLAESIKVVEGERDHQIEKLAAISQELESNRSFPDVIANAIDIRLHGIVGEVVFP